MVDALGLERGDRHGDEHGHVRRRGGDGDVPDRPRHPGASPRTGVTCVLGLGRDGPASPCAGYTPIGYYKDPEKSAATFRVIDGVRYTIPGDFATVDADGTVRLLGRGSQCINTGGEKVYPEEVEEVLKLHPTVADAAVVGVPDERFGEAITALVEAHAGDEIDEADADRPRQGSASPATRRPSGARRRRPSAGPPTASSTTAPSRSAPLPHDGAVSRSAAIAPSRRADLRSWRRARAVRRTSRRRCTIRAVADADRRHRRRHPGGDLRPPEQPRDQHRAAVRRHQRRRSGWPSPSPWSSAPCSTA